jgi:hypothetical protein
LTEIALADVCGPIPIGWLIDKSPLMAATRGANPKEAGPHQHSIRANAQEELRGTTVWNGPGEGEAARRSGSAKKIRFQIQYKQKRPRDRSGSRGQLAY